MGTKAICIKRCLLLMLAVAHFSFARSQDTTYINRSLRTLASAKMHGRGYTHNGMQKAAKWIKQQFDSLGLKPVDNKWYQPFKYPVNVFGKAQGVKINGAELKSGEDYLIDPASTSLKGKFKLKAFDAQAKSTKIPRNTGWLVADSVLGAPKQRRALLDSLRQEAPVVVITTQKLTWSVAQHQRGKPIIQVKAAAVKEPHKLALNIHTHEVSGFSAKNVMGRIQGTTPIDSLIIISAHYDHLGEMGSEAIFTGASDNASGTAMMLDMARYFKQHPMRYDIVFVAFAGEEAGLRGSKYFVNHPPMALESIRGVINLDLMGSAVKGIAVVNGKNMPAWRGELEAINLIDHYVDGIKWRGQAANSDHYWFSKAGVPAVFIYTMGNITAYHDVHDRPAVVDWAGYSDTFRLITTFIRKI